MIKLLILAGFSLGSPSPPDSVGTETINGKVFVIHKVDEKETLYAISRRYRTTVDAILEYNPQVSAGLEIGQVIKVPYAPKTSAKTSDGTVHTVAAKETLYSITRQYGVTEEQIRQWNSLSDNSISVGQELIIRKPALKDVKSAGIMSKKGVHTVTAQETMFSIAKLYGITVDDLKAWNHLEGTELKIGQTLYVVAPERSGSEIKKADSTKSQAVLTTQTNGEKKDVTKTVVVPQQTIRISESIQNGSETKELGLAELIEGTEGNRKYLARHRTAPIGSILKIKNEMNNREVFVRVMGKLPDTALTDKVLIRISKSAFDRLGAIDQRFRVEVTYYK